MADRRYNDGSHDPALARRAARAASEAGLYLFVVGSPEGWTLASRRNGRSLGTYYPARSEWSDASGSRIAVRDVWEAMDLAVRADGRAERQRMLMEAIEA